ncbi:hypothetical protein [uncultured Polaribacter sp.]|uniref:hypothetical protein n=1 Tax=uncultured Polaribacter sp. TaxID=174711 RepID=UPI0030DDAE95|tara:strand:+ start:56 stop:319 length:264 start_codon:yes stop_codon:yes gene_type:complete
MFSGLVYFGYAEYKKEILYKKAVIEQEKKYRFTRIIKSADFYLGREKLESTLKQYKFAKKLYPNDSLVNSRIKLVDSLIRVNYQIEK